MIAVMKNNINEIIKRDGRIANFNEGKIIEAIRKSFQSLGYTLPYFYYETISQKVVNRLNMNFISPSVEEIQDMVEEVLIENNFIDVAKAYIIYRAERSKARQMNSELMKTYEDIVFKDSKDSNIKRENANINSDTSMGTMLKFGSEGAKYFYKMFVLKPEHSKAHEEGDIHIHDLDFYGLTTTCCQIDLIKLFKGGFSTGHGSLREPNSIASYSALACIAIQSNQNDQHGGQSIPNFDYALAEGVKKSFVKNYIDTLIKSFKLLINIENIDITIKSIQTSLFDENLELRIGNHLEYCEREAKMLLKEGLSEEIISKVQEFALNDAIKTTERETYQAMESFIHNLNTMHSRAGAQTPFSSINYGMDTSKEGRMVIKNVLLALEKGLGSGETPIFPIHIFRVKEGINLSKEDENYDLFKLACRVSAKRLFPNFAFQDAPFNLKFYKEGKPETEIAYMGCRTRVIDNVYDPSQKITYGRGNLSFTSINLPRLGIKAKKDVDLFFKSLDEILNLCTNQLLERLRVISTKKMKNFPFLMGEKIWLNSEDLSLNDDIGEILKHGTLTIGFIGLAECLVALTGKHHGECEESRELGLKIVSFMREKMDEKALEHKLNFSLIATPAEGLSGRFVEIDRKFFGNLKGITDREYYTNSFHVPVYYKLSAYEKIRIEAPYHSLTNGGHITYVELDGDPIKNVEAFEKMIRFMKESGIGYGSINHPVDRDPVCNYNGIINDTCPKCGRSEGDHPFERIRRITGYLVGNLDKFNNAKLSEVKERVKHNLS